MPPPLKKGGAQQFALDLFKPAYNILLVAGAPIGFKHSEETKALMSAQRRGRLNQFYGKTHYEEVRQLLSEFNLGKNHPGYGKPRSAETIRKMIASSAYRMKPVYYYSWNDRTYLGKFDGINMMSRELGVSRRVILY